MEVVISLLDQDLLAAPIAVLDFEMTGLNPEKDRVCEVAVVRVDGGAVSEFHSLVRPKAKMSPASTRINGITDNMLGSAPSFRKVAAGLVQRLENAIVVCHNVPFDIGFLHRELDAVGVPFAPPVTLDTLLMARRLFSFRKNTLANVCEEMGIPFEQQHRALSDARATRQVFQAMTRRIAPDGGVKVRDLVDLLSALAPDSPFRLEQKRTLKIAFRDRRTVWLDYQSTGDPLHGAVRREVGIWAMNLPYLQAWCYLRQGERIFRLDRVRDVAPCGRPYEIPEFECRI